MFPARRRQETPRQGSGAVLITPSGLAASERLLNQHCSHRQQQQHSNHVVLVSHRLRRRLPAEVPLVESWSALLQLSGLDPPGDAPYPPVHSLGMTNGSTCTNHHERKKLMGINLI